MTEATQTEGYLIACHLKPRGEETLFNASGFPTLERYAIVPREEYDTDKAEIERLQGRVKVLEASLRETVWILGKVESDTNYGIHDEYEPRAKCSCGLCDARAVLQSSGDALPSSPKG